MIDRAVHGSAPTVRGWLSPETLWATVEREVDAALEAMSHSVIEEPAVPWLDEVPKGVLARLVESPVGTAIGQPTRRARGEGFWYIDVLAHDADLSKEGAACALADAVAAAFRDLEPMGVRLFRGMHEDASLNGDACRSRADFYAVAGLIVEVQRRPLPDRAEQVSVTPVGDLSWFDKYAHAYDEFHKRSPEMKGFVVVETRETMRHFIEHGVVGEVRVGGEWAGIVAAVRDADYGLRGYKMVEEILAPEFWGRGFAAPMQRRFIDLLDGSGEWPIVFGRISAANLPSLSTAKRVGRIEVSRWEMIEPGTR